MTVSASAGTAPVAVVGAGPVGLSLALALAREGVPSTLVEREEGTSRSSKAPGVHVRSREAFRRWGVEERLLDEGVLRRTLTLHDARPGRSPLLSVDFSELDDEADRPGVLFLEQARTEGLLLDAVRESGLCDVRFGAEAVSLEAGEELVRLRVLADGADRFVEARYVVGCDGASSVVRDALGLPFAGMTYSLRPMLADVRIADERDALPWPRVRAGGDGYLFALRIRPGLWRIVHLDAPADGREGEVSGDEVRGRVEELLGPGPFEVEWASRFRIHRRSAPRFRVGRVLLAGDAAHVHSPVGGLGMNAGVQDAHNLAWKLASALRGGDAERLLDSYEVERRAVVAGDVSRYTDLLTRLFIQTPAVVRQGLFALLRGLYRVPRARRLNLRRTAMIDLDYPADSPLLSGDARAAGVRLPNPPLALDGGGEARLYDLLAPGPALLDVADSRPFAAGLPLPALRVGRDAHADPTGALRRLLDDRDGWILVRPDLHVAWARTSARGLEDAVRVALGSPGPVAAQAPAQGLPAR